MATSSAKRVLIANGFKYERETNHGEVWTDGERNIMISRHAESEHPGLKKDLRNALRDREEKSAYKSAMGLGLATKEMEDMGKGEPVREPVQETKSPATKGQRSLPLLVMTILTEPELTDGQKVKMIMAYAELE